MSAEFTFALLPIRFHEKIQALSLGNVQKSAGENPEFCKQRCRKTLVQSPFSRKKSKRTLFQVVQRDAQFTKNSRPLSHFKSVRVTLVRFHVKSQRGLEVQRDARSISRKKSKGTIFKIVKADAVSFSQKK